MDSKNFLEELRDLKKNSSGVVKERPWRVKKVQNLVLADSLERLGYKGRAARVRWCATILQFQRDLESGEKKLTNANFCKAQLCPMCQWRKSNKILFTTGKVMDIAQEREPDLMPLFLTLTNKNCSFNDLSAALDAIYKGWHELVRNRKLRRIIKGWFRALEITYNEETDTWHPHIHAIILVDKSYFTGKDYMTTAQWALMWQGACGLDYTPVCDIRKCKTPEGKRKDVAEVAKYTLKSAEIFPKGASNTKIDRIVECLSTALHSRRLIAFGGNMKKIAKEIKAERPDEGDLVVVDGATIRGDLVGVIERYRWNFGAARYQRVKTV